MNKFKKVLLFVIVVVFLIFLVKTIYIKMVEVRGSSCGGIVGTFCPDGYTCRYDGNYPDAGGICIKDR